jgi:hypothetical protein
MFVLVTLVSLEIVARLITVLLSVIVMDTEPVQVLSILFFCFIFLNKKNKKDRILVHVIRDILVRSVIVLLVLQVTIVTTVMEFVLVKFFFLLFFFFLFNFYRTKYLLLPYWIQGSWLHYF